MINYYDVYPATEEAINEWLKYNEQWNIKVTNSMNQTYTIEPFIAVGEIDNVIEELKSFLTVHHYEKK